MADVQHGGRGQRAVLMEGGVGREATGADHRPAKVELVEQPLLEAVGQPVEQREVLRRRHRGGHVR